MPTLEADTPAAGTGDTIASKSLVPTLEAEALGSAGGTPLVLPPRAGTCRAWGAYKLPAGTGEWS